MARVWTLRLLVITSAFALLGNHGLASESAVPRLPEEPEPEVEKSAVTSQLTAGEQALVDFALGRFETQGLELPEVDFVFHDSLLPCDGHKGMYHKTPRKLEMCSMDKRTMLHELAHAWANASLTSAQMSSFVSWRNLDSWNDHDHAWERRGTEHVAETIAWALLDDPNHVKWVETFDDGSRRTTYRVLTLNADVHDLVENFKMITGQDPVFRHAGEWELDETSTEFSPELLRSG